MNYADYLLRKLQEGDEAFLAWFTGHKVDAFSGWLPADQTEHGFPPPERPADALWYFPSEEEEQLLQAPVSPEQYEVWQEEALGEVLVIRQCADIVMAIDHFAWFRIPLPAVAQYMQAQGDGSPKTVAALMREGATFRPQGFGYLYRAGKTCALGGALEALRGKGSLDQPGNLPPFTEMVAQILSEATGQNLFTRVRHAMKQTTVPVYAVILDLNDIYKWPPDRIAQWLETQPL
jgi:hypothetical protein